MQVPLELVSGQITRSFILDPPQNQCQSMKILPMSGLQGLHAAKQYLCTIALKSTCSQQRQGVMHKVPADLLGMP